MRKLLPILLLLAASCGGFTSPNLGAGSISGRIEGVGTGGQVYVLGQPRLASALAADGSFTIEGVPVGDQKVVVDDGSGRAGLYGVTVGGASVSRLQLDAKALPRAGRILLKIGLAGAALATEARCTVEGTVFDGIKAGERATALLGPLPPARFSVHVWVVGFEEKVVAVDVPEGGDKAVDVELPITSKPGAPPGCSSTGCAAGLVCDSTDGHCYACVSDADCGSGGACVEHGCVAHNGLGGTCAACRDGADCRPGWRCEKSDAAAALGYCAAGCLRNEDCPAGFSCSDSRCVVKQSCLDTYATFGAACLDDGACGALAGGTCLKDANDAAAPGYCTARCHGSDACPTALGFHCDSALELCVR